MGVLIKSNDREITQLTKIGGQLLYPAKLNPSHLLHKSGAVAMVFGPWEKRWIFGGWKFPTRRWTCWRFWRKWTNKNIHSWKLTWQWTTPLSMGNTSSNRGNSVAMLVFVGVIQPNSKERIAFDQGWFALDSGLDFVRSLYQPPNQRMQRSQMSKIHLRTF